MLNNIKNSHRRDKECRNLVTLLKQGRPKNVKKVQFLLSWWHPYHNEIMLKRGLPCRGDRFIIPRQLRPEIFSRVHDGHLGITKCLQRAKWAIFWSDITAEVNCLVEKCEIFRKNQPKWKYLMIQTSTPDGSWHKIATDFVKFHKTKYLVLSDYFSRYIEIARVQTLLAIELIAHWKKYLHDMVFLTKSSLTRKHLMELEKVILMYNFLMETIGIQLASSTCYMFLNSTVIYFTGTVFNQNLKVKIL